MDFLPDRVPGVAGATVAPVWFPVTVTEAVGFWAPSLGCRCNDAPGSHTSGRGDSRSPAPHAAFDAKTLSAATGAACLFLSPMGWQDKIPAAPPSHANLRSSRGRFSRPTTYLKTEGSCAVILSW